MDFQKLIAPSVTSTLPGEVGATWTLSPAPVETFTKNGSHYECLGPVTFVPEGEYAALTQGMRYMPWI